MNILFLTNYFGLHGSSIDLITFAGGLKMAGHSIYFFGKKGLLQDRFESVADGVELKTSTGFLPSLKNVRHIRSLCKKWEIDVVIGVGKFIALEGQLASLLSLGKMPISMMNFSPRRFHWEKHPRWYIPHLGLLTVNCPYYRDISTANYPWSEDEISIISARYEMPDMLDHKPTSLDQKINVLFVRRLDHPKYKSIINTLDQLASWGVLSQWRIKVIGGGSHEKQVIDKIEKVNIEHPESQIEFMGKQPNAMDWMKDADLVIGSERVAVEAMAHGCLTLLSTDQGLIDLITPENIHQYSYDNFFGHSYSPVPMDQIRSRLFSLLKDKVEFEKILQGNFYYVKNHFDVEQGTPILLDLFKKVTENPLSQLAVITGFLKVIRSIITIHALVIYDRCFGWFR